MGRPPSNGGPSFRFNPKEVAEMENILQANRLQVPERDIVQSLADKFSHSADREGKVVIQYKQVWNWFQNRRYAIRAKTARVPGKLNVTPMQRDLATVRNVAQAPPHLPVPPVSSMNNVPQVPQPVPAHSGQNAVKNSADNSQMEFEAKSSRDGAWYDVASFLSHKLENGGTAVLVRFAGFGPEEDEWVNVQKNVRQRSLPCEASECVAVLPNDLILCFQEGREQALYYDAHVLDAQRRRHDARGCRCRFLVRYDHDQSEEIVALRKVCRRPETDYRLQLLHADFAKLDKKKSDSAPQPVNPVPVYPVADSAEKKTNIPAETKSNQPTTGVRTSTGTAVAPVSLANAAVNSSAVPMKHSNAPLAPGSVGSVGSSVSVVAKTVDVSDATAKHPTRGEDANTTIMAPVSLANAPAISIAPMTHSNAPLAPASAGSDSSVPMDADAVHVADTRPKQPGTEVPSNSGTLIASASLANAPINISAVPTNPSASSLTPAAAGASDSSVSIVTNPVPVDDNTTKQQPTGVDANAHVDISVPMNDSNVPVGPAPAGAVDSSVPVSAVHSNAVASASAGAVDPDVSISAVPMDDSNAPTGSASAGAVDPSAPISAVPMYDSNAMDSASAGAVDPSVPISAVPMYDSDAPTDSASAGAVDPSVPISAVPMVDSNVHVSSASGGAVDSSVSISAVPTYDSNAPTAAASPGPMESSVSISAVPMDDSNAPTSSASAVDPSLFLSEVPMCDSNAPMDPASVGAVDSSLSLSEAPVCDSNAPMDTSAGAVDSSVSISVVSMDDSNVPMAAAPAGPVDSSVSNTAPVADSDCSGTCMVASTTCNPPVVTESTALEENISGPTTANNEVTNHAEAANIGEASGADIRDVARESGESMQID